MMKKRICVIFLVLVLVITIPLTSSAITDIAPEDEAFMNMTSAILALTPAVELMPYISVASTVWDFCGAGDYFANQRDLEALQILELWQYAVDVGQISETEFIANYTEIVNCGGSAAYFGTTLTVDEAVIVDAYAFVQETSRCGISLDELVEYIYNDENDNSYLDDSGNTVVTGDTFNDIIKRLNEHYSPKPNPDSVIISWQNDPYWSGTTSPNAAMLTVFYGSELWCNQDWPAVYMVPYYYDGADYWYSEYQYHWYFSDPVQGDSGANVIMGNCDVTSYITGELITHSDVFDRALASYWEFSVPGYNTNGVDMYIKGYSTINAIGAAKFVKQYPVDMTFNRVFYSTSRETVSIPTQSNIDPNFNNPPTEYDGTKDIGYICSSEPILLSFRIDVDKIPSNYYITYQGDNIYDYSITNPDTGENTTIYNYITNNYDFPAGSGGSSDNGSGITSGDITVGGNVDVSGDIDVGGKVDVNINVNVNDNSGDNGGTGEAPPSYIDDINVDLDAYLEQVPEVSDRFILYLRQFFSWLPAEIYGLLMLAVVVAVWCRLAGR